MTATDPEARDCRTNERVELGRYTTRAGERLVCGQRMLGVVRLVDVPPTSKAAGM